MTQAHALPTPSPRPFGRARVPALRGTALRRLIPLAVPPEPSHMIANLPALIPASSWREDLRFFGNAYLLGLVFFLILIV